MQRKRRGAMMEDLYAIFLFYNLGNFTRYAELGFDDKFRVLQQNTRKHYKKTRLNYLNFVQEIFEIKHEILILLRFITIETFLIR